MRTFKLHRKEDKTGVSGTGVVAYGFIGDGGKVLMRWTAKATLADGSKKAIHTTTVYQSWEDVILLHGHGGKTELIWDDTKEAISDLDILRKK